MLISIRDSINSELPQDLFIMSDSQTVSAAVAKLYNTYPFPYAI
ncbi:MULTISPECIES: hypothetical protein [unclassified Nostoc]|nr:hypothetical protein [Nostoc sp. S13]MDF5736997.1 hypothetical protein [Nostoc sp. S13]